MEETNLQRLSSISIAIRIWEKPLIKNQITNIFRVRKIIKLKVTNYNQRELYYQKKWHKDFQLIINSAKEHLNSLELSLQLKEDCKSAVQEIGEKIYNWMDYVTEIFDFDYKFAQRIYWQSNGTVDEDKIFKLWESDDEFLQQKILELPTSYFFACVSGNEDFITRNQLEMENAVKKKLPNFDLSDYENNVYTLMALYLYLQFQYKKDAKFRNEQFANANLIEIMSNNSPYVLPLTKTLQMCATAGFTKAFYYIWSICLLNAEFVMEVTLSCVSIDIFSLKTKHQQEKLAELLIFLMKKQMTDEQKIELFKKKLISLYVQLIPAQPKMLHDHFIDMPKKSILAGRRIPLCILYQLRNSNWKTKEFRRLFYKNFTNISKDLCREIFSFESVNIKCYGFEPYCFKLVISAMGDNFRNEAIEKIQESSWLLIKDGRFEWLQIFMSEILKTDEERNAYKEYVLSCIDEIVIHANSFSMIDKLLDILSDTNEERAQLKDKINPVNVCERFVKSWKYDKAEKFLQWMFVDEEERKTFRKSLNPNLFIFERLQEPFDISSTYSYFDFEQKDFLNFFFGFPKEKESVEDKEKYLNFRMLMGTDLMKEGSLLQYSVQESVFVVEWFESCVVINLYGLYDLCEIWNLFMTWICKDEDRKSVLRNMYDSDEQEKNFFVSLLIFLSWHLNSDAFGEESFFGENEVSVFLRSFYALPLQQT